MEFEAVVRDKQIEGKLFHIVDDLRCYLYATFTGAPVSSRTALRDYRALAGKIRPALQANFFRPSALTSGGILGFLAGRGPSAQALDDFDFFFLYFMASTDTDNFPIGIIGQPRGGYR